jgi:hypothetical protein
MKKRDVLSDSIYASTYGELLAYLEKAIAAAQVRA